MKRTASPSYVHSLPARSDHRPAAEALSPRDNVGKNADTSVPAAVDIWRIASEFPERWSHFLKTAYRGDLALIQITFKVCERTARRWLAGQGGVRAPHHVIANLEHPEPYRAIVLAEAA